MPKFLGAYVLVIAILCGLAFEGRSALTPSRATMVPSSNGESAEVHYAPGEDLESIDGRFDPRGREADRHDGLRAHG
jgi:hypothetical protein